MNYYLKRLDEHLKEWDQSTAGSLSEDESEDEYFTAGSVSEDNDEEEYLEKRRQVIIDLRSQDKSKARATVTQSHQGPSTAISRSDFLFFNVLGGYDQKCS